MANESMANGQILIEEHSSGLGPIEDMGTQVDKLCELLSLTSANYDVRNAFNAIKAYTKEYDRLLYANISNFIFTNYTEKKITTIQSNLISISDYVLSKEFENRITQTNNRNEKDLIKQSRKIVLKLYDHVNLANRQYIELKQTDEEYSSRFKENFERDKQELTKEMSSQLITLVGIFTALAFLIFGGISSLDNIFENIDKIPILKLIIICCVWSLGIVNLVYTFMFCVGKITRLGFNSNKIVKWSNFVLISILVISFWFYYIDKNDMCCWFDKLCNTHSVSSSLIGIVLIVVLIFLALKYAVLCKNDNDN